MRVRRVWSDTGDQLQAGRTASGGSQQAAALTWKAGLLRLRPTRWRSAPCRLQRRGWAGKHVSKHATRPIRCASVWRAPGMRTRVMCLLQARLARARRAQGQQSLVPRRRLKTMQLFLAYTMPHRAPNCSSLCWGGPRNGLSWTVVALALQAIPSAAVPPTCV